MSRIGIREALFVVKNVLPKVGEEELFDKAGITIPPSQITPFAREWIIGLGEHDRENATLQPGDHYVLQERHSKDAAAVFSQVGGVAIYPQDASPAQVRQATLEALEKARKFYSDRGKPKLDWVRREAKHTRDDMEELKDLHWPWHLNVACAERIAEEIRAVKAARKQE